MLKVLDLSLYRTTQQVSSQLKSEITKQLKETSYIFVKDPLINWNYSGQYFDLMESYYEKRANQYYHTGILQDSYPEYQYQIGIGKENLGQPNYDQSTLKDLKIKPTLISKDPKWKFFWPYKENDIYNVVPCIPHDFPNFFQIMRNWQLQLIGTLNCVSEILALTLNQDKDIFTNSFRKGPQYLAPIGCDMKKHKVGTIFSGYHYDLNFLTLHTKCRFPGLYVWLQNGEKVEINIPENHVFVQLGKQFEYVTGGEFKAGYHEAIYSDKCTNDKRWRVTSTLFACLDDDFVLRDLLKNEQNGITVGEQFKRELKKLNYKE